MSENSGEMLQSELAGIVALYNRGAMDAVVARAEALLGRYPSSLALLSLLGGAHSRAGRPDRAARVFADVVALQPDHAEGHYNLGTMLLAQGKLGEAIACFRRSLAIDPKAAGVYGNLGYALKEQGSIDDAIAAFQQAITLRPDYAEAHYNLGNTFKAQGRLEEAASAYREALALRPDSAEGHNNLGNALWELGRADEAVACLERAVAIVPDFAAAHNNMGCVLLESGKSREAEAAFRRVLALKPDNVEALMLLGVALMDLMKFQEAEAAFEDAIAIRPDYADARNTLGHLHLLLGAFDSGWRFYESRAKNPQGLGARLSARLVLPDVEGIAGKSVFVHHEQGLGDTIQFSRYAALLRDRGAQVILGVQNALHPLLRDAFPGVEVVPESSAPKRFDYHVPLMSLPLAFRTTVDTIPSGQPYVAADPSRVRQWRERIGNEGFRIGICWQGTPGKVDRGRSIPLECFGGIAKLPGVRLISLHKGAGESQLDAMPDGMHVETLGPDFDSTGGAFLDSAAVMQVCDLVITSDTSIAHLAGASGVPVWVVLSKVPDWRWLLDRDDSPWYPTMRLFRQQVSGDWGSAFEQVEAALGCWPQKGMHSERR